MINETLPGFKFDSFVHPEFSEKLRTPKDDRNIRLDNGNKKIYLLLIN